MDLIDLYERTQSQEFFLFYPTGSGKTRKSCEFAKRLITDGDVEYVIVIVPHTRHVNVWDTEIRDHIGSHQFSIHSINAFYHSYRNIYDPDRLTLFIVDEIHNILPKTFLSKFASNKSRGVSQWSRSQHRTRSSDDVTSTTSTGESDDHVEHANNTLSTTCKSILYEMAKRLDKLEETETDATGDENLPTTSQDHIQNQYEHNIRFRLPSGTTTKNENTSKMDYYSFLKDIFSRNYSRIILGLSATPFSNHVKLEIDAYYDLIRLNLTNYPEISCPCDVNEEILKRTSVRCLGDPYTVPRLYFFANRCVFPSDQVFLRYNSRLYFGTNEKKYFEIQNHDNIESNEVSVNINDCYSERVTFVQSDIVNLTSLDLKVPLLLVHDDYDRTQRLIENVKRVETLYTELTTPIKQLVVTYHLDLRSRLSHTLKRTTFTRPYQIIDLVRVQDASHLHDRLQDFNVSANDVILITNMFLSEGLGLKNVAGVHLFEPFQCFTAPDTIQILGRSCRYQSHGHEMITHRGGDHARVYTFLYAVAGQLKPIQRALRKERAIRYHLVAIQQIQKEIFRHHFDSFVSPTSMDANIANVETHQNIQVSSLTPNLRHIDVNSLSKMLDMALDLESVPTHHHDLETNHQNTDHFKWFNCCLLTRGRQIIDTSQVKCKTLLYHQGNSDLSYNLAQFVLSHQLPPNSVLISGTSSSNMSKHIIEQKDIDNAHLVLHPQPNRRAPNIQMRPRTLKGVKLKNLSATALIEVAKSLPNLDSTLLTTPHRNLPQLREYIYDKSKRENRYWDSSKVTLGTSLHLTSNNVDRSHVVNESSSRSGNENDIGCFHSETPNQTDDRDSDTWSNASSDTSNDSSSYNKFSDFF